MRGQDRTTSVLKQAMRAALTPAAMATAFFVALAACNRDEEPAPGARATSAKPAKSAAADRALRRAFDGAPPVIPHAPMGAACTSCHNERGVEVPGVGFAPPSPHEATGGMSATSRCQQCHVFRNEKAEFVANSFAGLLQDLRKGERLYQGAPPVMPHPTFMRENCLACHSGPAAREEIRCSHPERSRCLQCHATPGDATAFKR